MPCFPLFSSYQPPVNLRVSPCPEAIEGRKEAKEKGNMETLELLKLN